MARVFTSYIGYRVGQIRVIFALPERHRSQLLPGPNAPTHLAYVEWFSAFTAPDPHSGLYKLKPVIRNGDRLASVIPLRSIRRSVYLFPMFGPVAPREWTSGNVLDSCTAFYLDAFSDRHAYHTIH